MVPSAQGGDKIEFSVPGTSLEVPRLEREDKGTAKTDEFQPPTRPEDQALEANEPDSSEVLFVSPEKRKSDKTSDSAFSDSHDNDAAADSFYDKLDSKPRSSSSATSPWAWQSDRNLEDGNRLSEKRSDKSASEDNLRTRLEAVNTQGRTDYQRDDRYGRHSSDSSETSAWSHSLFNHGLTGLERLREGQFVPVYDDMNTANQQAGQGSSPTRPSNAADDLLRNSTLPPGVAAYNAQVDAMRGKTPDETMSAPHMFRPVQSRATVSQNLDVYAREEPPASPPGQVQSRPAILPFPKKPGDVLR